MNNFKIFIIVSVFTIQIICNEVPDNFIENELKSWLNENFDVNPEIPLKK